MDALDRIIAGEGEITELGDTGYAFKDMAARLVCADGMTVSVQAGRLLYSTPRDNAGPYSHVEVGYPDVDPPESWAEYGDGDYPSDVYGYVPVEMVREFVEAHGGLIDADSELGKAHLEEAGERMSAKMEEAREALKALKERI